MEFKLPALNLIGLSSRAGPGESIMPGCVPSAYPKTRSSTRLRTDRVPMAELG
jgi:hypothetical protein